MKKLLTLVILFASSFVVYGDNINSNNAPINELNTCNPKSIFEYPKLNILWNFTKKWTSKSIF